MGLCALLCVEQKQQQQVATSSNTSKPRVLVSVLRRCCSPWETHTPTPQTSLPIPPLLSPDTPSWLSPNIQVLTFPLMPSVHKQQKQSKKKEHTHTHTHTHPHAHTSTGNCEAPHSCSCLVFFWLLRFSLSLVFFRCPDAERLRLPLTSFTTPFPFPSLPFPSPLTTPPPIPCFLLIHAQSTYREFFPTSPSRFPAFPSNTTPHHRATPPPPPRAQRTVPRVTHQDACDPLTHCTPPPPHTHARTSLAPLSHPSFSPFSPFFVALFFFTATSQLPPPIATPPPPAFARHLSAPSSLIPLHRAKIAQRTPLFCSLSHLPPLANECASHTLRCCVL